MECLGLHNKPKAEVHPGHELTGPKEEEEELQDLTQVSLDNFCFNLDLITLQNYS
jgi:hypothetical protein